MISERRAREIAGNCVDPDDADDNKLALFAATGRIEAGLLGAVFAAKAYAEDYIPSEVAALAELHGFVKENQSA